MLDQLRKRQKALRYDYEKIRKMPKPEQIDDREIELVYNQFKSELGNAVVKSLNGKILSCGVITGSGQCGRSVIMFWGTRQRVPGR